MALPDGARGSLAEQALENLVNQFARPLDFLRELAQNSIDAGSPRIEVALAFDPPSPGAAEGVVRISVDDWGDGMDEAIIDHQLTRLFASSKENDLTKIGKFGIGFTSIFAIRPDAVLLRTGRHGEYWELLFHPDRTFDKVRIEEPVQGTRITLFKRLAPDRVANFLQEVRFVLGYWCEHSDVPITFTDRTAGAEAAPAETDDPFAAFGERAAGPEPINRPLRVGAELEVAHVEPGLQVAIGFADPPRYGFYNGGLTLLNTQNTDALGPYAERLQHLSFKVKHDGLEHTLTRDNVLQDAKWHEAMGGVVRAVVVLRDRLLERVEREVRDGGALGPWHARLAEECAVPGAAEWVAGLAGRPLLRDGAGRPLTLQQVRAQEGRLGGVLTTSGREALDSTLIELGLTLVPDAPETRRLLAATEPSSMFGFLRGQRPVRRADEVFVLPALVDRATLPTAERDLLARVEALLAAAVGLRVRLPGTARVLSWEPPAGSPANRLQLRVGDFGGMDLGRTEVLALNGPGRGRVFLRPEPTWFRLPAFLHFRTLLVNRQHPLFRAQLLAAGAEPDLAAYGLATALLHVEGLEGEAAFARMWDAVCGQLGAGR